MRFQPGRPTAARRLARHALGEWLRSIPCSDTVVRDAELVSELITNTIVHTRSAPTIAAPFDEGRLHIEVHDQDGHRHAPATSSPPAVGGGCDSWPLSPTGGDGYRRGPANMYGSRSSAELRLTHGAGC
jgi:hypothetical protein